MAETCRVYICLKGIYRDNEVTLTLGCGEVEAILAFIVS